MTTKTADDAQPETRGASMPFALTPVQVERVWGTRSLDPWYTAESQAPVGEVWLNGPECRIADGALGGDAFASAVATHAVDIIGQSSGEFPLLVKMLFPADHLSVQVHPDDDLAEAMRSEGHIEVRAKTECWYVLSAEPGATVALGLKPGTTQQQLDESLGKVDMEALLHHEPVSVDDMIYVDAGTVHAIGPGVVLLEVQQTSDTTYRLWDYGRPRDLHLVDGARAIKLRTSAGKVMPKPLGGATELIRTPHFTLERHELVPAAGASPLNAGGKPECLAVLAGRLEVLVDGVRATAASRGGAVIIPACVADLGVRGVGEEPCIIVRCRIPA